MENSAAEERPAKGFVQDRLSGATAVVTLAAGLLAALQGLPESVDKLFAGCGAATSAGRWSAVAACAALTLVFGLRAVRRRSVLLRPQALRVDPADPRLLGGRERDIASVCELLRTGRLVFIEGRSGSGKTALLRAGVQPVLAARGWIPVHVDLAGVGWEAEFEQVLRQSLRRDLPGERKRLVAAEQSLQKILDLLAASTSPVCLLFDQLDDYQSDHIGHFRTGGVWKNVGEIESSNSVWAAIARALRRQRSQLHVLFAVRADMAAGLGCVRFVKEKTYQLASIEAKLISPVLDALVADTAEGPVVLDPESGWKELKARLVRDIAVDERILPIQFVVVLETLHRLKHLTVGAYEAVGGAQGLERLHIERNAADAAEAARIGTKQVLVILQQMGDPQGTKTEARSLAQLQQATDCKPEALARALESLEASRVLRRHQGDDGSTPVWLLRHDFLARGVLAAQRSAGRWQALIDKHEAALTEASGLAGWWSALLPARFQLRLAWEGARGRVALAGHGRLLAQSLARFAPALLVVAVAGVGWASWRDSQDEALASEIYNALGQNASGLSPHEVQQFAELMRANERVRAAVVRRAFEGPDYDRALSRIDLLLHAWWQLDPTGSRRARLFDELIPAWLRRESSDPSLDALVVAACAQDSASHPVEATLIQRLLAAANAQSDPDQLRRIVSLLANYPVRVTDAQARALAAHLDALAATASDSGRAALGQSEALLLIEHPILADTLASPPAPPNDLAWRTALRLQVRTVLFSFGQPAGGLPGAPVMLGRTSTRDGILPSALLAAFCARAQGQLLADLHDNLDTSRFLGNLDFADPRTSDPLVACLDHLPALPANAAADPAKLGQMVAEGRTISERLSAAQKLVSFPGEIAPATAQSLLGTLRKALDETDEYAMPAFLSAWVRLAFARDPGHSGSQLQEVVDTLMYYARAVPSNPTMLAQLRAMPKPARDAIVHQVLDGLPTSTPDITWAEVRLANLLADPADTALRQQVAVAVVDRMLRPYAAYDPFMVKAWADLTAGLDARASRELAEAILHPPPQAPAYEGWSYGEPSRDYLLELLLPLASRLDDAEIETVSDRLYASALRGAPVPGDPALSQVSTFRAGDAWLLMRWVAVLGDRFPRPSRVLDALGAVGASVPDFTLSAQYRGRTPSLSGLYTRADEDGASPDEWQVERVLRGMPIDRLVDILKLPYALGPVRRIALGAIGEQVGMDFHGDLWAFVAWARTPPARRWKLDLDAPPQRWEPVPAPRVSPSPSAP